MRQGWRRITHFGPGLVFVLSALGAGDIVSNAASGAQFRFSLAWVLLLALVFRFVWLDASARYVLLTGESLLQGLHRLGAWLTWLMFGIILVVRHALNLSKVLMLGEAVQLLVPLPWPNAKVAWSLLFTAAGFLLVGWGGYSRVEKLFTGFLAVLGGSLAAAALVHFPDPRALFTGLFVPAFPESSGPFGTPLLILALIGTEAGSMTNLTYSYFVREKGWRDESFLRIQRRELLASISCMFLMGVLLQITAAGVFATSGGAVSSTGDLVRLLEASQGTFGVVVFALGLFAAVFTGLVGATTGYALMAVDAARNLLGWRWLAPSEPGRDVHRDPLYRILAGIWILGPAYILLFDVEAVHLLLITHAVAALMIPFLSCGLLYLINRPALRHRFRRRWLANTVLVLIAAASVGVAAVGLIQRWF